MSITERQVMVLSRITLAPLLFFAGAAFAQSVPDGELAPASLSLKGVSLGMPLEDAKAKLGITECKEFMPGVVGCANLESSLNGMPAQVLLNALDGKVVRVEYRKIKFPDSESIRDALVEKYGEPPRSEEGQAFNGPLHSFDVLAVHWGSERGEELSYVPWGSSEARMHSLATVALIDHTHYDLQWMQRRQGVYTKPAESDI